MKNRFKKIISALLIFSFLVAAFSVFSFAETTEGEGSEENTDNLSVIYNRDYEEGWNWDNGFAYKSISTNTLSIDHEEDSLGKYNYFVRYEATSNNAANTRINFGTEAVTHGSRANVPGTVIELSVKADDVAKLGTIAYIVTSVGRDTMKMIDINKDGELVLFNGVSGGNLNLGKLENEWVNFGFIFDWSKTNLSCKVLVGHGLNGEYTETYPLEMQYVDPDDVGIFYLYLGFPAYSARSDNKAATSYGMNWCLDNLKVYQGVRSIIDIEEGIYGSAVNALAEKVIDIQEAAGIKSKGQLLEEALAMKVGVEYALLRNQRYSLINNGDREEYNGVYGAPKKDGDNVLIPLQLLLDYIGFPSYIHPDNLSFDITTGTSTTYMTLGRDTATVDGKRVHLSYAPGYLENDAGEDYLVIALDDVPTLFPGWLALYDDMGLVIIYEDTTPEDLSDNAPIVNRNEDLTTMVDIMKKFVFDTVTDPEDKALGYIANGTLVYEDTKANTSFAHPYLITNADTFAKLAEKYALSEGDAGYDALLKASLDLIIAQAEAAYLAGAKVSGVAYAGLKDEVKAALVAPATPDGYDARGEMAELVENAKLLPILAFAFQITDDSKYAQFAYDIATELASWQHWGPGYMIDCAEAVANFAIGYDWLYNEYKELGYDTEALALAIYELGVHDGYVASSGKVVEHARGLGDLSVYNTKTDSTNAIGTSGMMIGALAILDFIGSENAPEKASEETLYLIGNNIQSLIQYGLDIYAPDGSYIESAVHWEAATSAFFRMVMAIDSAAGTDYGFMSTWGIDKTCYYAIHIEDSDGFIWNYHDGGFDGINATIYDNEVLASLNTDMFNFVGSYLGDANLIAVRVYQMSKGKLPTVYDLLFYPFDGIEKAPELELDYHLEAIDGFVTRSGWENGSIYAGIMGGMNNVNHGQIDSGNFIYRNGGINWVVDLGTENPYINEYDVAGTRYKYYRVSGEGQNVIIMTENSNMNYGQYSAAGGFITATAENEHGAYAILDNSSVYLSTVSYAKRGVLITNDRTTVVLQDELSFVKVETLAWVLHTGANIEIDDDGRVAYFTQRNDEGKMVTVRAAIVSQRPDFVFTTQSVDKPILSNTLTSNKISGAEQETSRKGIQRLVITAKTISFDVAVVFEMIDDINSPSAVGYKWTPMVNWEPSSPSEEEEVVETVAKRGATNPTSIKTETTSAENMIKRGTAFVDRFEEFYKALATVEYTLKDYPPEKLDYINAGFYADYLDCLDEYEEFYDYLVENIDIATGISRTFCGIETEID